MNLQTCRIQMVVQRSYDREPPWLLTLDVPPKHAVGAGLPGCYPQARAVVDDFGNLVIVRGWI